MNSALQLGSTLPPVGGLPLGEAAHMQPPPLLLLRLLAAGLLADVESPLDAKLAPLSAAVMAQGPAGPTHPGMGRPLQVMQQVLLVILLARLVSCKSLLIELL